MALWCYRKLAGCFLTAKDFLVVAEVPWELAVEHAINKIK
jgi:hypothetical protein